MEITGVNLAKHYEVTGQTVQNWIKAGCPSEGGGKGRPRIFDTVTVHNWLIEREIGNRVVTKNGEFYDRQEEEARLKHHQANLEQIKEAEKIGELIPLSDAVSEFGELVANARAKLLSISKDAPSSYKDKLDESIREALDELSKSASSVQE